jgi:AraC-like DNA-binding protein
MVESGQSPIRAVDFQSPGHLDSSVEVIERSELFASRPAEYFAVPERPSFHVLVLVRAGRGVHTVDFEEVPAFAGRLIQSRPGQVQQWNVASDYDASIVLSRPYEAPSRPWFPGDAAHRDLGPDSMSTAEALVDALRREQVRFVSDQPSRRLMNALFASLCALFDRAAPGSAETRLPDAYVAFRSAIEVDLGRSKNARDYIAALGHSERTVNRACKKVTGQTAKAILDERLVLEAKRLLAHTDKPAAAISAELGFGEPTNFHKFFARHAAQKPSDFRKTIWGRT